MAKEKGRVPLFDVPAFQGPLDLLLLLIQQEKIDISDIPIAQITDQFIEVVQQMESLDMEVTTGFLVMAAQLLYLKSRLLLPKTVSQQVVEQSDEDPRQELVERLLAYKTFKYAAQVLGKIETSSGQRYFREVDIESLLVDVPLPDPLLGVSFKDLCQAFIKVIERAEQGEEIRHIQPEEISLEIMINDVLRRVILQPQGIRFQQLIRQDSRIEAVMVFLALLELLKRGKVKAEQAGTQADILIFSTQKAWEFTEEE
ncbi:MAG: segregation and condensation protein A [Desulfitobacteriaceae bacterium]